MYPKIFQKYMKYMNKFYKYEIYEYTIYKYNVFYRNIISLGNDLLIILIN